MSEPAEATFEVVSQDHPDARTCLDAYYAEIGRRFGFDLDASISTSADEVAPPHGVFLVVRTGGQAVGCGGLRTLEPGVGEIKRMWVSETVRGRGVGRRLLGELERYGREMGLTRVRLDTNVVLTEAIGLYTGAGYRAIERYNDDPNPTHFFEKELVGVGSGNPGDR